MLAAAVLVAIRGGIGGGTPGPEPTEGGAPEAARGFVEDRLCASCHPQQYREWRDSHHDLAMQEATEATVRGDFEDAVFRHFGVQTRFFRRDGRFLVNTEGPDGTPEDFEVRYPFGVEPLQQYLLALPGGRFQALGIAWDTERNEWFPLYPDEAIPAGDALHWTGWRQNANSGCIECHVTGFRRGHDATHNRFRSTWTAGHVGCQACHGPGGDHVAWADGRTSRGGGAADTGLRVEFSNSVAEVEACAACHALRTALVPDPSPEASFPDSFRPALLTPDAYYADGQILGEVFEYGSFIQSRMFAAGVRCSDCHHPHTLELRASGNAVCTQCHRPDPPLDRFPTLPAKDYDSPAHHFHPEASEGARCANCHLPERAYMIVDPRRDHSFRIPRPDVSAATGSPDACTTCHSGQDQEWAATTIAAWYGPERRRESHYGPALAGGRRGRPAARTELIRLIRDREQPAIVRATATQLLIRYGSGGLPVVPEVFEDSEPLVRAAAAAGLETLAAGERFRLGTLLLEDPVRLVRVEAARAMAPRSGDLRGRHRDVFLAAASEVRIAAGVRSGTPESAFNLGNFHIATGDHQRAVRDYRSALALDPAFVPASLNLATLLSRLGRNTDAEDTLQNALAADRDSGDTHYALALLMAEDGRLREALPRFERATELLPDQARVHYNHGLALQRLDRRGEAEAALRRAHALEPDTSRFLHALAVLHAQEGRWAEALPWAERATETGGGPDAGALLARIRRELSR